MSRTKEFLKIIGTLFLIILATLVVGIIVGAMGLDPTTSKVGIILVLLSQVIFAISAYLILRKKKREHGDNYILNQGFKSDSWKMIIIGFGCAGFGNILISLVMQLMADNPLVNQSIEMVETALNAQTGFEILIQTLVVVIVAPIVEEYLFRGYVFTETKRLFNLIPAILISGLLFGLYHMNLLQGINTFVFGIVLALVYYYRKNITDSILVHFANNGVVMLTTFLPQYQTFFGIVLLVSIFLGLYFLVKTIREGHEVDYIYDDNI